MSPTPPRALAIDIDGTLINSEKRIPPFTRAELHRVVRDYGVEIALVTARGPQSADMIQSLLGLRCSVAAFGGALVRGRREDGQGMDLAAVPLDTANVDAMIALGLEHDVYIGVHTAEHCLVNRFDYWARREARNTSVWPVVAITLGGRVDSPVYKIMFRGEPDVLAAIAHRAELICSDVFVHHNGRVIEIIAAGAVKLLALRTLGEFWGLPIAAMAAFGDSEADMEMIENVGVGVLMANANSGLDVSGQVVRTLSNDEDGIGIVLRELFPTDEPFRVY